MGDTIRCDECGAAARESSDKSGREPFCRFCGAAFRMDPPPAVVVVQEARPEHPQPPPSDEREPAAAPEAGIEADPKASAPRRRRSPQATANRILIFMGLLLLAALAATQCSQPGRRPSPPNHRPGPETNRPTDPPGRKPAPQGQGPSRRR